MKNPFSMHDAKRLKAVALLLMMVHHCFIKGRFEQFGLSFYPLSADTVMHIATYAKICVSMFAFVSGYGLYLSYKKENARPDKWVAARLVKTLSPFWFIYVLSFVVCMLIDRRPIILYGFENSVLMGFFKLTVDFLGLSAFFGYEPLCATWWYMSAAVVYVVLCPLLYRLITGCGNICTVAVLLLCFKMMGGMNDGNAVVVFLSAFSMGMIFADMDLFAKFDEFGFFTSRDRSALSKMLKALVLVLLLALSYKLYHQIAERDEWNYLVFGVLPLPMILIVRNYIINLPIISKVLDLLGKHTTNIFLTHTFIRYYYLEELTYSWGHFLGVLLFLLISSLLLSIIIESLKKMLRNIYRKSFAKA